MGSLEDAYQAELNRRRIKEEEEARKEKPSSVPTPGVIAMCREFGRLIKKAPEPIAIATKEIKSRPASDYLSGKARDRLSICRDTGAKGWWIKYRNFAVTTDGQLIRAGRAQSVERKRHFSPKGQPPKSLSHLEGARVGTWFIITHAWPFDWSAYERVSFHDKHPDYPDKGPTITVYDPDAQPVGPSESVEYSRTGFIQDILMEGLL